MVVKNQWGFVQNKMESTESANLFIILCHESICKGVRLSNFDIRILCSRLQDTRLQCPRTTKGGRQSVTICCECVMFQLNQYSHLLVDYSTQFTVNCRCEWHVYQDMVELAWIIQPSILYLGCRMYWFVIESLYLGLCTWPWQNHTHNRIYTIILVFQI